MDSTADEESTKGKIRWPRFTRDSTLLIAGLALTVNEIAFRDGPERPYVLIMLSGMMGLPVFLRRDER